MNRRLQSGGRHEGYRPASPVRAGFARWPLLACFLAFAIVAPGCSTVQKQHSGDPLVGEYYPKAPNGNPLPPPPAPGKTSSTSGPFPSATSANSTAAIAANTTLPGGKQLAIPQPNWMLTNNPKTGG